MEDEAVIRRVQEGESEAYALLVRKHHQGLLRFINRLVRDRHLAEDIGQEVFLDAYKALPRFDPDRGTPFGAWLAVLARNRCVSVLRRQGRTRLVAMEDAPDLDAGVQDAADRLIAREERQALAGTLEQLEEPFRSAILMSLEGELVEDIAVRSGVPVSTVKTRLFRAREKLRRLLAASLGGVVHERQV